MIGPRSLLLVLCLAATPALAQSNVLRLPGRGAASDSPYSHPAHPIADPVTPVEQSGTPTESHHTHHEHHEHHAHRTPVVRAQANSHAEKPAKSAHETAKPAHEAAKPAPPPAKKSEAAAVRPKPDDHKGSVTGLPLPRFAALRSDEVNLRVGPGMRFPIEWQYHRRELPVEILRELEVWRLVEDQDGVKGWVHQATLTGRRGFVVRDRQATLRGSPEDTAGPVAILKPGVVGRLRHCPTASDWCEVEVAGYRGWLRREQFWGTFPGEAVN